MSVKIEFINDHTIYLHFSGILNYQDRLATYTQIYEYTQQHTLKYILVDMLNMMYFDDKVVDNRLNNLIKAVLERDDLIALVTTSKNNEALLSQFQENFMKLGVSHKFYLADTYADALSLLEKLAPSAGT